MGKQESETEFIDLDAEYKNLSANLKHVLKSICAFVSGNYKDAHQDIDDFLVWKGNSQRFPEIWDGSVLFDYLDPAAEDRAHFDRILNKNCLSYDDGLKRLKNTSIRYLKYETVQKLFIASAWVKGSNLKAHLLNYVESRKDKEFVLYAFRNEYFPKIEESLAEALTANDDDDFADDDAHGQTQTSTELTQPPYQIKLELPTYQGSIHYFGSQAIDIIGRTKEQSILHEFLEDDMPIAWFQIAGVAGQGKSRLALYLAQYAISHGWEAGFLDAEDFSLFSEHWEEWQPQKPHLFVFDYVIGREQEIGSFFDFLRRRQTLSNSIRVLLVERQRWDKGGFHRPRYVEHQSDIESNVLDLSESLPQDNHAEWFKNLCVDDKGLSSSKKEAYLRQTQFKSGIREVKQLNSDDLFSIVQQVAKLEGFEVPDERQEQTVKHLRHIDAEGRPLYAYFYAQMLLDGVEQSSATRDDLLTHALYRQYEKRWRAVFHDTAIPWSDDTPTLRLAVLATITKGVDCKSIADKQLMKPLDASTRHQAMVLTDTPFKAIGDPGNIILPLLPDLLGEWLVLESFNEYLPVDEIMDAAWQYNADETATFLVRLVQDFPDHYMTNKILQHPLPDDALLKSLSIVATDIFIALMEAEQTKMVTSRLTDALFYAANIRKDQLATLQLAVCYKEGFGVKQDRKQETYWWRRYGAFKRSSPFGFIKKIDLQKT